MFYLSSLFPQAKPLPPLVEIILVENASVREYPQCPHCGIKFKRNIDLRRHLRDDDWSEHVQKKYPGWVGCDECCVFFKTMRTLLQHNGKAHSKDKKNYACVICQKCFKNKHALKFHKKQVHEKSTRESCPLCGKEFYNKYLIPEHLEKCRSPSALESLSS